MGPLLPHLFLLEFLLVHIDYVLFSAGQKEGILEPKHIFTHFWTSLFLFLK